MNGTTTKCYLGDGCYVAFDGYALVLTTEDGVSVQNRIVLEPDVYASLIAYVDALRAAADRGRGEHPHAQDGDEDRS